MSLSAYDNILTLKNGTVKVIKSIKDGKLVEFPFDIDRVVKKSADGVIYKVHREGGSSYYWKSYDGLYVDRCKRMHVDLEGKIWNCSTSECPIEIVRPEFIVYNNDGSFDGQICPDAGGVDFWDWFWNLPFETLVDLPFLITVYKRFEEVVRSVPDYVFPDLLTPGNLRVILDEAGNFSDIRVIDFEGIQIGNYLTNEFSCDLEDIFYHENKLTKYFKDVSPDKISYKKELDRASLILLFFSMVFGCELASECSFFPSKLIPGYLKDNFNILDEGLIGNVCSIFENDKQIKWLGDGSGLTDLVARYSLVVCGIYPDGTLRRTLVPKCRK